MLPLTYNVTLETAFFFFLQKLIKELAGSRLDVRRQYMVDKVRVLTTMNILRFRMN